MSCEPKRIAVTLKATGTPEQLEAALAYLRKLGYKPEILKEVPK